MKSLLSFKKCLVTSVSAFLLATQSFALTEIVVGGVSPIATIQEGLDSVPNPLLMTTKFA